MIVSKEGNPIKEAWWREWGGFGGFSAQENQMEEAGSVPGVNLNRNEV